MLLLAWPFRWEKEPIRNNIKHVRDRWTGDEWVCTYTSYGVNVEPSWSSLYRLKIIPRPGTLSKLRLWGKKFVEAQARLEAIKSSSEFKSYNEAMGELKYDYLKQREQKVLEKARSLEKAGYGRPWRGGMLPEDLARLEAESSIPKPSEEELFSYAWNNLPENLRKVGASAMEEENKLREASSVFIQIEKNGYLLVLGPYGRRITATLVWAALVVFSGLRAWKGYTKSKKLESTSLKEEEEKEKNTNDAGGGG